MTDRFGKGYFGRVNDLAKDISGELDRNLRCFADMVSCLEEDLRCRIRLVPMPGIREYRGNAILATRTEKLSIDSPPLEFYRVEHVLFYDSELSDVAIARLVAHELFHICQHHPEDPAWDAMRDPDTGVISYGVKGEVLADEFSLAALRYHGIRPGASPPKTAEEMIGLLDSAGLRGETRLESAAWPDHMEIEAAIQYIHELYRV